MALLLSLLVALPAWAGQAVLEADTRALQVGQSVGLHLTLVDARAEGVPAMPEVDGLSFVFQGSRQSVSRINGASTRTQTFTYGVTALKPGRPRIPAVEVRLRGEVLRSNPLELVVSPRAATSGDSEMSASLGVPRAWVGQTLVYTVNFRTRLRVMDRRWTPPAYDGLVPEQSTDGSAREYQVAQDGEPWSVIEIYQPLVTTTAGRRAVPPGVLNVQFPERTASDGRRPPGLRMFSNVRNEVFTATPDPIDVRPLPAEGRSPDFSGLVGRFSLRGVLDDHDLKLGESATLTVTLRGDGTLVGFALPEAPADAGYRAYDDDPERTSQVDAAGFLTEATFRRAIVPERTGQVVIEPIRVQVFDPVDGRYVELATERLTLEVTEGEGSAAVSSFAQGELDGRQEVASLGDDILPVHLRVPASGRLFDPAPALALALAPWLAVLGLVGRDLLARRRGRPDLRRALRERAAALDGASTGELEDVFREALGLALGCPPAAVDRDRVRAGLPEALAKQALEVYDGLDRARYGAAGGADLAGQVRACVLALLEVSR